MRSVFYYQLILILGLEPATISIGSLDFISFLGGIAMIRKKISRRTFLAALPAAALVLAGCGSKSDGASESTLISENGTASKADTAAPSIASRKVLLVNYPSHSTLKLLNPDGTEICSLESCDFSVPLCKDGKFPIRKKEKFGYADIDGNLLLEPIYDYPPSYVDGFFTAVKNGMTGYADADGSFFLSPQYSDAGVFSHGLAPVKQDDLWGFIDRSGEFVIPPQFESKPSSFSSVSFWISSLVFSPVIAR